MEYLILAVSLVGIVLGADYLVSGAVSIARKAPSLLSVPRAGLEALPVLSWLLLS